MKDKRASIGKRAGSSLDSDADDDDIEEETDEEDDENEMEDNFRKIGYESKGLEALLSCSVIKQNLLPLQKVMDPLRLVEDSCLRHLFIPEGGSDEGPSIYCYDASIS